MVWQYDVPGTKYWEGLPVGTGRFAAMIPGALEHEVIAFNDETLWTGGPYNPNPANGPETLQKVRERVFARDYTGADREAWALGYPGRHVQFYQPMGRLNLDYTGHELAKATHYNRKLNMDDATVDVSYRLDDVNYSRQVFASYPDQVIVIRLTADKKGRINLSSRFTSLQPSARTRVEGDEIVMEGTTISEKPGDSGANYGGQWTILPPKMRWQSRVKVIREGGEMTVEGDKLTVTGADAVTLLLAGATNWVSWNDVSADEKQRCTDCIVQASQHTHKDLLRRHLDDYRPLFAACRLNLGADPHPEQTTSLRMEAIRNGEDDPAYDARYFQYGRYLLLAAARENTLAFNNHNIWLDNLEGRWQGRWTLNINLNECYWPVENTNLPRVNESLLLFVENLAAAGRRTAEELFGCRGWCACHGTDVWFNTAPTDGDPQHATWPVAAPWLMQQLYDHYEYDPDPAYLKRIYPLMKGVAEFLVDFLVEDPVTGYMVTNPSTSPENRFLDGEGNRCAVSFASACDIQIIRDFLRNCIRTFQVLNTDPEMQSQMTSLLDRLPPHKIGKYGQLQEWFYDFDETELTHRHMMHLYAFYPDDDITLRRTPELADAVRMTLRRRQALEMNFGWSGAWKIGMYARLEEPDNASLVLGKMEAAVSLHPYKEDSEITPSFEGNQAIQGVTAGIAEMLMQSHSGELSLLPALPRQWKTGAVSGLRARGGYEVDMEWTDGALTLATVKAKYGGTCRLRTQSPVRVFAGGKEIQCAPAVDRVTEFETKAGSVYSIKPVE
jgi:alpha-L-fucosidase 2